jgi:hypothetical protein
MFFYKNWNIRNRWRDWKEQNYKGVKWDMRHALQPTPYSCGQTCIAMVSSREIGEIFAHLPDRKGGTNGNQIRECLRSLGIDSQPCKWYRGGRLPNYCIVLLTKRNVLPRVGHWVVHHYGTIIDPEGRMNGWYDKKTWEIYEYIKIVT